jgi:ribonucleoside-diphosphate reductase beta chain
MEQNSNLFEERRNLKPFEYPEFVEYKDAIRHSYWVHDEFNFDGDVQDFRVECTPAEQEAIKRTMLAIAQIEVSVKTFWAEIYNKLPKPEVAFVGLSFAESEGRHADAYSHLLELLGLNKEFERIDEIPALRDRIQYLDDYMVGGEDVQDKRDFALSVLLFSIFIEHVSLFSQFLIMLAFDRETKRFKGMANAVEATSKEEQIHGLFGVELIQQMRDENPEWFDSAFEARIRRFCRKAEQAEMKVLDWILEEGELDFLPREVIDAFVRDKFNRSLRNVDMDAIFDVREALLEQTRWFYEEILMTKDNDFFQKRGTAYSKMTQSVSTDDLF